MAHARVERPAARAARRQGDGRRERRRGAGGGRRRRCAAQAQRESPPTRTHTQFGWRCALPAAAEFGEEDERERELLRLRHALHQRNAERFLALLWRNRGLYIKVGQVISAMAHVLPPEYVRTLRPLQDHAPRTPFATVRATIESELGCTIEDVFDDFETEAIAR